MRPLAVSLPSEIFRNQFVRLYSVGARFETHRKEYFITEKGVRVGLLVQRGDELLLVRQYRFLINDESWEIPGGGVDDGETPEEAAVRECREEAGVLCTGLRAVFDYRLGLDVTDASVRLFRASAFQEFPELPRGRETDTRKWVRIADCLRRVQSGELQDLMTIVAVLVVTHPELS